MVKKGENDLSRSAHLFRFADMIYDMRFNGHSVASIVNAVNSRLNGRRVSRPTITEFLQRVDDPEFRAAAKAYCENHNLNYVEWHEIAKLAQGEPQYAAAAPVRQGDVQVARISDNKPNKSPEIQNKTETQISMPAIKKPANESVETFVLPGFKRPATVIHFGDGKIGYKPEAGLSAGKLDYYEGELSKDAKKAIQNVVTSQHMKDAAVGLHKEYGGLIPPADVIYDAVVSRVEKNGNPEEKEGVEYFSEKIAMHYYINRYEQMEWFGGPVPK